VWASLCLALAAWLKARRGWRTGLTRKVFHFLTFASACVVQLTWGTPALCLFAGMVSLVVLHAVLRGAGHPLYEALAREADAPHRTWYVLVPYVATAAGGIAANVLFGRLAIAGYLVCGIGDAVGEPAGVRFGRHRYRVPLPGRVPSWRSLEGSLAVFAGSLCALTISALVLPEVALRPVLLVLPAIAAACTVVEAVSPHGWDNVSMQVVPAFLVSSCA
jgi:phytol kinase